jgi:hypothetical protein
MLSSVESSNSYKSMENPDKMGCGNQFGFTSTGCQIGYFVLFAPIRHIWYRFLRYKSDRFVWANTTEE